jgi:phospholipid/cholesterol/gamma-HCH transport system ATP-binding protein
MTAAAPRTEDGHGASTERRPVGIEVRGLRKTFGGVEVLRGVDLTVQPGELMVILGGSGEGKSVLLRHIAGLITPDGGSIRIGDLALAWYLALDFDAKPFHIAMVFQNAALLNSLTVADNVALPLREHGVRDEAALAAVVRRSLEQVDLAGTEGKLPGELSGGMRKRAAVARALAMEPQVILYDEPTADLDPILTEQIGELIVRIKEQRGATQVLVTHNLTLARAIADHIALLHQGRIVDYQTADGLARSEHPLTKEFLRAASLRL